MPKISLKKSSSSSLFAFLLKFFFATRCVHCTHQQHSHTQQESQFRCTPPITSVSSGDGAVVVQIKFDRKSKYRQTPPHFAKRSLQRMSSVTLNFQGVISVDTMKADATFEYVALALTCLQMLAMIDAYPGPGVVISVFALVALGNNKCVRFSCSLDSDRNHALTGSHSGSGASTFQYLLSYPISCTSVLYTQGSLNTVPSVCCLDLLSELTPACCCCCCSQ